MEWGYATWALAKNWIKTFFITDLYFNALIPSLPCGLLPLQWYFLLLWLIYKHPANTWQQQQPSHTVVCQQRKTLTDFHCCLYQRIPNHSRNPHFSKQVSNRLWYLQCYSLTPFLVVKFCLAKNLSIYNKAQQCHFLLWTNVQSLCVLGFLFLQKRYKILNTHKRPSLNAPAGHVLWAAVQRTCKRGLYEKCSGQTGTSLVCISQICIYIAWS